MSAQPKHQVVEMRYRYLVEGVRIIILAYNNEDPRNARVCSLT